MKRSVAGIAFGCSILGAPLAAQPGLRSAPSAQVDTIMTGWIPARGPGAAVLVLQDGVVVLERGFGFADVARKVPIGPTTRFLLGSVSKQFTALAIMMLVERHQLSYDDPLRKFFPDFPPYADSISVRHLLHHLGGLPEYEELFVTRRLVGRDWPRSVTTRPSRYEPTAADARRLLEQHAKPGFPAGERFQYSNSGYMILAQIVERVSGERFAAFMRREVFDPLGMRASILLDETTPAIPDRALSYTRNGGRFRDIDYTPFNHIYGEDNVVAPVGDVGRWILGLDSARLVSRQSLDLAYTPGRTRDGRETGYGFGWTIGRSLGARVLSHGGSWVGFRTVVRRYPEHGLAVVVLANWAEADPESVAARIAGAYIGERLERRAPVRVDDSVVRRSLGRYLIRGRLPVTVRKRGSEVWIDTPLGPNRIMFDSDSTAFVYGNPAIGVTFRSRSLVYHHLERDIDAERQPR